MRREKRILGIDEAGRGCVIGSMVICGILARQRNIRELKRLGVKDSKELSPRQRKDLMKKIKGVVEETYLIEITPQRIDRQNLNTIESRETAKLIERFKPDEVYFDVPARSGRGVSNYSEAVKSYLSHLPTRMVGENKADKNYPVVSAASILAKVHRDMIIERLKKKYGDFGSGYPSEEKTKSFLLRYYKKHKEFPRIVRLKWSTIEKLRHSE